MSDGEEGFDDEEEQEEEQTECWACGYKTSDLTHVPAGGGMREAWLCRVCYCTHSGKAVEFPGYLNDVGNEYIMKQIAWVANWLHDAIMQAGLGK